MSFGVLHSERRPAPARDSASPVTDGGLSDIGLRIHAHSIERWGAKRPTMMVGRHPAFVAALERLARFAHSEGTVLITGETGTGKELFARALYLLSPRRTGAFISVNCAQYQDPQLSVSELFGHRRGSFTGAVGDHRGVFEAADGGVLFLDEIGELSAHGQAILLRALSDGEILGVGEVRPRQVDVRIVAATNRHLKTAVDNGTFRADLYFRLRALQVAIPPMRDRGDDWELILAYYLRMLNAAHARHKHFSSDTMAMLGGYRWPGNARELHALVETGFHESEDGAIEPCHVVEALEDAARANELKRVPIASLAATVDVAAVRFEELTRGSTSFWDGVYRPYLARELNRSEVQEILAHGLACNGGSYKQLIAAFGLQSNDYLRFMDFLRHHRLKPERAGVAVLPGLGQRQPSRV